MDESRILNRRYETIAWGAFFILLGVTNLFKGLPEHTGALGIGIILLGLNIARYLHRIPTSSFTITIGAIALVLGTADIIRVLMHLQIDLPIFPILLIIIGIIWFMHGVTRNVN